MDKKIKKLQGLWNKRAENIEKVSQLICEINDGKEAISPYQIAIRLGAISAEVLAYISFHYLPPKVKEKFLEKELPISLALDLIEEETEIQEKILDQIKNETNIIEKFVQIKKKYSSKTIRWMDELSGVEIIHLVEKAKSYGALTNRQRKALFQFGKMRKEYKKFSDKQEAYLKALLEKCKKRKLISTSCFDTDCEICKNIVELYNKSEV